MAENFFDYLRRVILTLHFDNEVGPLALQTRRHIAFTGLLLLTHIVPYLVKRLGKLSCYRLSQDHIEFLFGDIRMGLNNNPDCKQFPYKLRQTLLVRLPDITSGNCIGSVSNFIIPVIPVLFFPEYTSNYILQDKRQEEVITSFATMAAAASRSQGSSDPVPDETNEGGDPLAFSLNADATEDDCEEFPLLHPIVADDIAYIAGCAVRSERRCFPCDECYQMLTERIGE